MLSIDGKGVARRALLRAATIGVCGLLIPLATFASLRQQEEQTAEQLQAELELVQSQITQLETQLVEMGERRDNLVDEFESADVRLALSQRHLDLIQLRLQVLFRQARERQAEVDRLTAEQEVAREELSGRVVALYRMGPLSYSRFLLAADNPEDVLANYQLVGRLAAQDRTLVAGITRRIGELEQAVEALSETAAHWEVARDEEARAVRALGARQERRRELIRRIDIEAAAQRQAIAQQEDSAVALAALIAEVSAAPEASATEAAGETEGDAEAPASAFAAARGSLPWPAEGRVTETFGRKVHPVYETVTLFNGIEIEAGAGTPVHAVFAGNVVYADWFESYGLMVVLDHGDSFFTIYGHLDRVAVRRGERVEPGADLGTVGESGSLIGPSLYFEIREGTDAINPARWLRSR